MSETPNQKIERLIAEARDRGWSENTTLCYIKGVYAHEYQPPLNHNSAKALISEIYAGAEP